MNKKRAARGFSLIEFMIAITVSLIILAALTSTFVANSRARAELEKSNQQIENGRYALSVLTDDLQLAGFLAQFNVNTHGLVLPAGKPTAKPSPCTFTLPALGAALAVHIQGYDNVPTDVTTIDDDGTATVDLGCLPADVKPGTDIIVVRHASTCVTGTANCPVEANAPYFQTSNCATELNERGEDDIAYPNARATFRLGAIGTMNRTQRDCATAANVRKYLVRVYFIANNDRPGDGIPTLKRAELSDITAASAAAGFTISSIANGIEDLQVEYGIDHVPAAPNELGGTPDVLVANPDIFNSAAPGTPFASCAADAAAATNCAQNWENVTTVKVSVLSRNLRETRDYTNDKVYTLGLNATGGVQCAYDPDANDTCDAFGDRFRRHVYQTAIRLTNPAGRRE